MLLIVFDLLMILIYCERVFGNGHFSVFWSFPGAGLAVLRGEWRGRFPELCASAVFREDRQKKY